MSETALQKLGANNLEELIDAILPLTNTDFESSATYCRVLRVENLTIRAVANSAVEIPLSEVANLQQLKAMNTSKPWDALINSGDVARYLDTMRKYPENVSPFLEAQFFHIMLPTLDRHFTSHLLTSGQVNEVIQYLSYLKLFLQTWFRTSGKVLVQTDESTEAKELGLTHKQVITQSYHIVFHLLKRLFSIAQKAIYGNGYQVNVVLSNRKQDDKASISSEELIDGLQDLILDFISNEAMPWVILGELLNQLLPLFPLSYQTVRNLAISRLFQHIEHSVQTHISDTTVSILVQVYNTQVQPTKRQALSHLLNIINRTLDSVSVKKMRTDVWMLVALLRYNETDVSQAREMYRKFPFGRVVTCADRLNEGTKKCLIEVLTLPTVASHFLNCNSDYPQLVESLVTFDTLEHFIELRKWQNMTTLHANNFIHIDFLRSGKRLEVTLSKALFRNMPPQLLPLFDFIPIELLSDLYSYIKCFHEDQRKMILEHLCQHTRNRYNLIENIVKEEGRLYPEWGEFSKVCATRLSRRLSLWVIEKTQLRLRFCPKMLMFDIASQYI